MDSRSDDELLTAARTDAEAFAAFYRRHARPLTGFLVRRTRDAETAADLVAETFATALADLHRFDPRRGEGAAWLYGIARNKLRRWERRGAVDARARRRLGLERIVLEPADLEAITACDDAMVALGDLPEDQRAAVLARVVHERGYEEIAVASGLSEPAVRQRVSRGLASLRARLKSEETS